MLRLAEGMHIPLTVGMSEQDQTVLHQSLLSPAFLIIVIGGFISDSKQNQLAKLVNNCNQKQQDQTPKAHLEHSCDCFNTFQELKLKF